jgi:hypothetical protein
LDRDQAPALQNVAGREDRKIYASPKGLLLYRRDYDGVQQLRVWQFLHIFRNQSVCFSTEKKFHAKAGFTQRRKEKRQRTQRKALKRKGRSGNAMDAKQGLHWLIAYWRQRPLVSVRIGSVRFQPSGLLVSGSATTRSTSTNENHVLKETSLHNK